RRRHGRGHARLAVAARQGGRRSRPGRPAARRARRRRRRAGAGRAPGVAGRRARWRVRRGRAPGGPRGVPRRPGRHPRRTGRAGRAHVVPLRTYAGSTYVPAAVGPSDTDRHTDRTSGRHRRAPTRDPGVTMSETTQTATHGVVLTDVAAAKVRSLLEQEG